MEVGVFLEAPAVAGVIFIINCLILGTYILSGILVRKGIPFGFYLGFGMFTFVTILSFLVLFNGIIWGLLLYIFQAIRFGGLVILATNFKTAVQASKHQQFKGANSEELLDSSL